MRKRCKNWTAKQIEERRTEKRNGVENQATVDGLFALKWRG